ncbi:hypothetical protein, partial [Micromonospora sp. CB01531]|uniref:hypothetical protein n=1 Tax=Micromonospora sp. CB01531 TaxID=1718947 RepID=UPI001A7E1576
PRYTTIRDATAGRGGGGGGRVVEQYGADRLEVRKHQYDPVAAHEPSDLRSLAAAGGHAEYDRLLVEISRRSAHGSRKATCTTQVNIKTFVAEK